MKPLNACIYKSPIDDIGEIRVIADGEQLCLLDFNDNNVRNQARFERLLRRRYGNFKITRQPMFWICKVGWRAISLVTGRRLMD